jgi:uncharacterized protein YjbJ (UPF0337 family)
VWCGFARFSPGELGRSFRLGVFVRRRLGNHRQTKKVKRRKSVADRLQRAKGAAEAARGRVKRESGIATARPAREARGAAKEAKGKTKKAVGKARSAAKKATR